MEESTGPNPMIATRLDREIYEQAQQIAEANYDGNMALLARIAIKRFVAANYRLMVVAEDDRALAAVAS